MMLSHNRKGQLWNNIRRLRQKENIKQNVITLATLKEHFSRKFSNQTKCSLDVKDTEELVKEKHKI